MPEWLVEEGIGEHRAVLADGDTIVAARLDWPGTLAAGQVEDARLIARPRGSKRGTVRFASGEEALIDGLPADAREGAPLRVVVTRAAIGEAGRLKRAQARPTDQPVRPAPSLADRLRDQGQPVRVVRDFPLAGWDELHAEARERTVSFDGGTLIVSPTPGMTVIDVDGALPPRMLAQAAVGPVASTIRRFDLAGSIGIDFPTLGDRADRKAIDEALAAALGGWRHERTAMNGFGFIQIVARHEHPSLVHRIAMDRPGAAARALLRRGERVEAPGVLLLTAHPAVRAAIAPEWEAELARRTGRMLRWSVDAALALDGGFAQALAA